MGRGVYISIIIMLDLFSAHDVMHMIKHKHYIYVHIIIFTYSLCNTQPSNASECVVVPIPILSLPF